MASEAGSYEKRWEWKSTWSESEIRLINIVFYIVVRSIVFCLFVCFLSAVGRLLRIFLLLLSNCVERRL